MNYPSVHITLSLEQVLDFVQQLPLAYQEALFAMLSAQLTNQFVQEAHSHYAHLRGTLSLTPYQKNRTENWQDVENQPFFKDENPEILDQALRILS